MRICLLTDESIDEFNPSGYLNRYEWDFITVKSPVREFLHERVLCGQGYDVYLNLYEGDDEGGESGLKCIEALEALNLPFTGADSGFYEPTRETMQRIAEKNHIRFARGFHVESGDDLARAKSLVYPLIVKHPNSFASTGLTRDSRVENGDNLESQFEIIRSVFGSARVEEFIEGREFSCLVVENADDEALPHTYPPAEVQFPDGESFLHENAKWYDWGVYVVPLRDDILACRIQDVSKKFFVAMNGVGYARVDLRLRPNGEIVILEINPNCGILFPLEDRSHSDLSISWDKDGHDGFLDRIFRSAMARHRLRVNQNKNPA